MIDLIVNGRERSVEPGATILSLLEASQINPLIVAVERNGEIVKRDRFAEVQLQAGDRLEIVRMVGGG